jgi:hypothetical protein
MTLLPLTTLAFSSRSYKKPTKTTAQQNASKALRQKQYALPVILEEGAKPVTLREFMRANQLPVRTRGLLASLITACQTSLRKARQHRPRDEAGALRAVPAMDPDYRKWANRVIRIRNFLKNPPLRDMLNTLPPCRNTHFIGDGADCLAFRDKKDKVRKEAVLRVRRVRNFDTDDYKDPRIAHLVWQPKPIARVGDYVIETQPYAPSKNIRDKDIDGIRKEMAQHGFVLYDDHPDNFGRRGEQVKIVDVQVPLKED